MSRLVIAEKPSVGRSIAKVLGAEKRGDGYMEGGGWIVSWCLGHLAQLADASASRRSRHSTACRASTKRSSVPIPAPTRFLTDDMEPLVPALAAAAAPRRR